MIGRYARWILLLGVLVFGINARVRYFGLCVHDDAWISFRYARNLARGAGLVMNPGERVEGITNFLWTIAATPVLVAGADPEKAFQIVGAVLGIALPLAAYWFGAQRLGSGWFAFLTPVLMSLNLALVMESLSGLETLLFAVLTFAAYVAFLEERRDPARTPGLWAALCGAATTVRPEGVLLFALLAGWAGLGIARGEPAGRLWRGVQIYALLVLPLLVFRLAYYGVPFPNTFYTKVGYTADQIARGWRYTRYAFFFPLTLSIIVIAMLAPVASEVARRRDHRTSKTRARPQQPASWTRLFAGRPRDEAIALAVVIVIAWVLYVMVVGGDYEPTARFYTPVLVLVCLAFQEGLRNVAALVPGGARRIVTAVAFALGLLLGVRSALHVQGVLDQRGWPYTRKNHHDELRLAGEFFRDHTRPGVRIALSSIGALAYYADRPIYDMMGLTDAHIGRRHMPAMGKGAAGHEKGDGDYILSKQPDIILLDKAMFFKKEATIDAVFSGARGVSEIEIVQDPRLRAQYDLYDARLPTGILYWLQRKQ